MLKKIILVVSFVLVSFGTFAQSKYKIIGNEIVKIAKPKIKDVLTKYTFKIKDSVYPVYVSRKDAFYILRVSKRSGKSYKQYLKITK